MKHHLIRLKTKKFFVVFSLFFLILIISSVKTLSQENSISGFVFSNDKSALINMNVELMDDLNRTISRTRTDDSGRYYFNRLPFGVFRIKVFSSGTDLAEQTQQAEITTLTGRGSDTQRVQLDFIMKPRKTDILAGPSIIFVQEVPENARKLYESGIAEINKKNVEEGIRLIKESLKTFPDYVMALSKLGYEYTKLQQYEPAIESLKKAVSIYQNDFTNWHTLGFCYLSVKKPNDAIGAIEKAVKISPASSEALLLYGIALRQSGKFEDAEKQMLNAEKTSKNKNPDVHWQLALLYAHNLKKYSMAADELELYLKAQPDAKDAENIRKLIQQYRQKK